MCTCIVLSQNNAKNRETAQKYRHNSNAKKLEVEVHRIPRTLQEAFSDANINRIGKWSDIRVLFGIAVK